MDIIEFRKQYVQQELRISKDFGKILSIVDFGNVNYWFEEDRQTHEYVGLKDNEKLFIDIVKIKEFLGLYSHDIRFYYGHDPLNNKSLGFIHTTEKIFRKRRVFTKAMQKVRHYLDNNERNSNTRALHQDNKGEYVYIPKCNFDVEISVDAIKVIDYYETICLLSGDADFVHLLRFLKQKGKKVILIKAGHITHQLKDVADMVINAQDIKKHIVGIKQRPSV